MKRSQLILATLALPIDYIMLVLAGILAYQIRFLAPIQEIKPVIFQLPVSQFLPVVMLVSAVWVALFALAGLYSLSTHLKLSQEVGRIFLACTAGLSAIILFFFFNFYFFSSRFIVLAGWLMAFCFASLGRVCLRYIKIILMKRGFGVTNIVVVGSGYTVDEMVKTFKMQLGLGFKVLAHVNETDFFNQSESYILADEIIIGDPNASRETRLKILDFCTEHQIGFRYAADMFEAQSHNVAFHALAGVPIIEIKKTTLQGWGRIVKRLFDLVLALVFLVVLSPLLLILGILVVIDSGWPVVATLSRVGEKGKIFKLYKFRSMIQGAEKMKQQLFSHNERTDGPLFKMSNDPRITSFGKIIRRWSLDELLQLFNVLKGDMSLVGPRPHEPGEVAKYETRHRKLLSIKPGITGLAQVSGRSHLTFEEEVKLDTFYVENWTLWQDIVILIKTVVVVLQRKDAV